MSDYDRVSEATAFVRERIGAVPSVAVVLGSGLGAFAERLAGAVVLPYTEIPHWPASHVVGHAGRLHVGESGGRPVVALAGRAHFYEGHPLTRVTFGVRVLGLLGVRTLVLTNAAGGVNTGFQPGTLMVIDDHINLFGTNPLIGPHDERLGPRFQKCKEITDGLGVRLRVRKLHRVG